MSDHDEILFQRVNQVRAKHVSALRIALNAAGMREKRAAEQPIYNQIQAQGFQGALGIAQATTDGYDIERVIQSASALRAALKPFDTPSVS